MVIKKKTRPDGEKLVKFLIRLLRLFFYLFINYRRTIMKELIYINPNKEDNCKLSELNPNWKNMLSEYMTTHYILTNKYEVHNKYFIAIDSIDEDTISILNKAKITIYTIDRIVGCILIKFKDEKSRDLIFNVLKGKVA